MAEYPWATSNVFSPRPNNPLNTVKGNQGATHSYSEEEVRIAASHINEIFATDPELAFGYLPLTPDNHKEFFDKFKDGVILCKLMNDIEPNIIPQKHIKIPPKSIHEQMQNLSLVFDACKKLNIRIVNIGAQEIVDGREYLILAILWKLTCESYLKKVSTQSHPEIHQLILPNEDHNQFSKLSAEATLMRWFNFHLMNAGSKRLLSNFSSDISDGECYLTLLSQISSGNVNLPEVLKESPERRAQIICDLQKKLGLEPIVTPQNILKGDPKSNLLFVAHLFDKYPALSNQRTVQVVRSEADINHQLELEAELARTLAAQAEKDLAYEQQLSNLQHELEQRDLRYLQTQNQVQMGNIENQNLKDQLAQQQEQFRQQQLDLQEKLELERKERERQKKLVDDLEKDRLEKEILEWERQEQLRREQLELQTISEEQRRNLLEQQQQLEREKAEKKRMEEERKAALLEQERQFNELKERQMKQMQEQQLFFQTQLMQQQQELERQRLENERLEMERQERERREKERLENEARVREQLQTQLQNAQNEAERQRLEMERQEWERQQREKADRERAEKERAEWERKERERLENERLERERREREERDRQEWERIQREKAEWERLERERLERERLERERLQEWERQRQQQQQQQQQHPQPELNFEATIVQPQPQQQQNQYTQTVVPQNQTTQYTQTVHNPPQNYQQTNYQQTTVVHPQPVQQQQYTTTVVQHHYEPTVQHTVVHNVVNPNPTYEQNVAYNYANQQNYGLSYEQRVAMNTVPSPTYVQQTTVYHQPELTYEQRVHMNTAYQVGVPVQQGYVHPVGYGPMYKKKFMKKMYKKQYKANKSAYKRGYYPGGY